MSKDEELKKDFEEQYQELINEEQKKYGRQSKVLVVLFLFTFLVSLFGTSFLYYTTKIAPKNKTKEELKNVSYEISYPSGKKINLSGITAGYESFPQTFSIRNIGNAPLEYKVSFKEIVTDFNDLTNLTYTLYKNEEVVLENELVSATPEEIYVSDLEKDVIDNYQIIFKYNGVEAIGNYNAEVNVEVLKEE